MKFLIILGVFCFATVQAVPVAESNHTLQDSINDFLKLVDFDKILPIVLEGMSEDEQVIAAIEFLQGPEFVTIVSTVQSMQQFRHTLQILYDLGLDVYFYLNSLAGIMGWPEIQPDPTGSIRINYLTKMNLFHPKHGQSRTLLSFIEKLQGALPLEAMNDVYQDKLKNDQVFIDALTQVKSEEFNQIGDVVQAMDEWKIMLAKLEEQGIDTKAVLKAIMDFFGWH